MIQKYFVIIWGVIGLFYPIVYFSVVSIIIQGRLDLFGVDEGLRPAFMFSLITGIVIGFLRKRRFNVLIHEKVKQTKHINSRILYEGFLIGVLSYLVLYAVYFIIEYFLLIFSFESYFDSVKAIEPGFWDPLKLYFMNLFYCFIFTFGTAIPISMLATWVLVNQAAKSIKEG